MAGSFSNPDPQRFEVSKRTLMFDSFMSRFIVIGGIGVILAVFGIFFFILSQVIPLFGEASVKEDQVIATGVSDGAVLGLDEWSELPFVVRKDGTFLFFPISNPSEPIEKKAFEGFSEFRQIQYKPEDQRVLFADEKGNIRYVDVRFRPVFGDDGSRTVTVDLKAEDSVAVGLEGLEVTGIDMVDGDRSRVFAMLQQKEDGSSVVRIQQFNKRRALGGKARLTPGLQADVSSFSSARVERVLLNPDNNEVILGTAEGEVIVLRPVSGEYEVLQRFHAFEDEVAVSSMDFLLGRGAIVFTGEDGSNVVFSSSRDSQTGTYQYQKTKQFRDMPGAPSLFAKSMRNRAFLIATPDFLSLRYSTTEAVRWQAKLDRPISQIALSSKYDKIATLDPEGQVRLLTLDDPHPEAGLQAFFSKIWYEGQSEPTYTWQSTGGSSSFEPKLSLVPVIFGSLKGTFYSMLFAVPIALLAAIYTSQFLKPEFRRVVKPAMELMASLPSVVLGFLAALWLAPLIADRIGSVIAIAVFIPLTAVLIGFIWTRMPVTVRLYIPQGYEFIVFIPILLAVGYVSWQAGPALESLLFTHVDPQSGVITHDFRTWWTEKTDSYDSKNSLIIGIMMGFAVIPIIFTITEDALSNVPSSLISGSLALGASRWQTAYRVVLPTASAGIFSALMIGLGRAVGETMIVVMATGNTPLMDWNVFNGFRSLSANIAVELPEAPHHGTLYRTLFLGAFVLFLLTFFVNTLAEVLRTKLRERYKHVG